MIDYNDPKDPTYDPYWGAKRQATAGLQTTLR
jgi:hypothetical protein